MALYVWGHLHGDAGSIVKVLEHVLALGVLSRPAKGLLQGEAVGPTIRVVQRGTLTPACGNKTITRLYFY